MHFSWRALLRATCKSLEDYQDLCEVQKIGEGCCLSARYWEQSQLYCTTDQHHYYSWHLQMQSSLLWLLDKRIDVDNISVCHIIWVPKWDLTRIPMPISCNETVFVTDNLRRTHAATILLLQSSWETNSLRSMHASRRCSYLHCSGHPCRTSNMLSGRQVTYSREFDM